MGSGRIIEEDEMNVCIDQSWNNNLNLKSQIVTSNNDLNLKSQFATSKNWFTFSKMDIGVIDMFARLEGMKVGDVKQ